MGTKNNKKKPLSGWRVFVWVFKMSLPALCIICIIGLAIIGIIVGPQEELKPSTETSTYQPSGKTVTQKRQKKKTGKQIATKNEETPSQESPTIADTPKEFYLRIAFFNDTETGPIIRQRSRRKPSIRRPLHPNCRMWISGFGDFYPARDRMWEFGGALIERAGPFDVNSKHMIYFYPDYSNERRVFKVPFKYSAGMNPKGSVKDMLSITVNDRTIIFEGIPIKNVNGELEYEFSRKTFRRIATQEKLKVSACTLGGHSSFN